METEVSLDCINPNNNFNNMEKQMKYLIKLFAIAAIALTSLTVNAGGVERHFLGELVAFHENCSPIQEVFAFKLIVANEMAEGNLTEAEVVSHPDFTLGYLGAQKKTCNKLGQDLLATDILAMEILFNL